MNKMWSVYVLSLGLYPSDMSHMRFLVEAETKEEAEEKCKPLVDKEYSEEIRAHWNLPPLEYTTNEFRAEEPHLVSQSEPN